MDKSISSRVDFGNYPNRESNEKKKKTQREYKIVHQFY